MISKNQGFTLLEILVALAMLAISLTAAQRAMLAVIEMRQEVLLKQVALWIVDNEFQQIRIHGFVVKGSSWQHQCGNAGYVFQCVFVVKESDSPIFKQLDISVINKFDHSRLVIKQSFFLS